MDWTPDPLKKGYNRKGDFKGDKWWNDYYKNENSCVGHIVHLLLLLFILIIPVITVYDDNGCNAFCAFDRWKNKTINRIVGYEPPPKVKYTSTKSTYKGDNWIIEKYKNQDVSWKQQLIDSTISLPIRGGYPSLTHYNLSNLLDPNFTLTEYWWNKYDKELAKINLSVAMLREADRVLVVP